MERYYYFLNKVIFFIDRLFKYIEKEYVIVEIK